MKTKTEGKFERKKFMKEDLHDIGFRINMDCKDPPSSILDCKKGTRKKTIPLKIKLIDTPLGPKSCTKYITNWRSIQNIEIEISLEWGIDGPIDCWIEEKR